MYQNTTGVQANPKLTVDKGEASILRSSTLGRLRGGVEAIPKIDFLIDFFFFAKGLSHFIITGRLCMMVPVNVVVNRTVVVDNEYVFYCTGCRNVSHCQQQQSYSGLRSPRPGRSYSTYLWLFLTISSQNLSSDDLSVAMDMEMMTLYTVLITWI